MLYAFSKIHVYGKGYMLRASFPFYVAQTEVPHLGSHCCCRNRVTKDASHTGWERGKKTLLNGRTYAPSPSEEGWLVSRQWCQVARLSVSLLGCYECC